MIRILTASLLSCSMLTACAAEQSDPNAIPWPEAIRILNEGDVDTVFQTHDRWVQFTKTDGSTFSSRAPGLDLVIDEIEACAKCKNVGIILE